MHPRRVLGWTATFALIGAALLAPRFAASQPQVPSQVDRSDQGGCISARPEKLPSLTTSGSWTPEGDLLLLDNLGKSLFRYSSTGEAMADRLPSSFAAYLSRWYPTAMIAHGRGYLIQVDGNRFVSFDSRYTLDQIRRVNAASGEARPVVDKLFSWTATTNDIYGVADVRMPDGETWWSGFVRVPLDNPANLELIEPIDDEERVFYRLSFTYLATTDDVAYALRMDNQMGLYRFERGADGKTTLEAVPSFERLYPHPSLSPQLPIFKSPDDVVTVMRSVEQSRLPVGLYGGDGLYVLSRAPRGGATTEWSVSRITPKREADKLLWTSPLPSRANHLSVVEGADRFAFVEKGPVRAMSVQAVRGLLLVPASRMRLDNLQNHLCD